MSRSDTAGLFCSAGLHRQSTGALTSRAAFPSHGPHFRNRLPGALLCSVEECRFAPHGALPRGRNTRSGHSRHIGPTRADASVDVCRGGPSSGATLTSDPHLTSPARSAGHQRPRRLSRRASRGESSGALSLCAVAAGGIGSRRLGPVLSLAVDLGPSVCDLGLSLDRSAGPGPWYRARGPCVYGLRRQTSSLFRERDRGGRDLDVLQDRASPST